jgi:predicted transcriptional regulator
VTVLNRLVEKGLLARATSDGRYRYSARIDEATFVARTSRRVMERVLTLGEDAVAASFVDVLAERDPALLRELARLVQQKLDTSDTSDT